MLARNCAKSCIAARATSLWRRSKPSVVQREPATDDDVHAALLELRSEEVDARDVPDEERAAAEEKLRIVGAPPIRHEEGDVLRRVPWCRYRLHTQGTDLDGLAVGEADVRVRQRRTRTGDHADRP